MVRSGGIVGDAGLVVFGNPAIARKAEQSPVSWASWVTENDGAVRKSGSFLSLGVIGNWRGFRRRFELKENVCEDNHRAADEEVEGEVFVRVIDAGETRDV